MNEPNVTLEMVHVDPDYLEVVVTMKNDPFSGAVALFTNEDDLAGAAGRLSGFQIRQQSWYACFEAKWDRGSQGARLNRPPPPANFQLHRKTSTL